MGNGRVLNSASRIPFVCATVALLATAAWAASTTRLIYSFAGNADGEYTDTELAIDSASNLYGTSVQGGKSGAGTVFQVTPAGVHTVLYSFTGGTDGGEPYKGVTLGPDGNLYGTAVTGGGGSCEGGCGVVFKLTNSGGTWTHSVIHTFTGGNDGSGPGSPVAFDKHGNLYGTTPTGGSHSVGVIYQMQPNGSGGWRFRIVHAFTGGADGLGGSAGRLLISPEGRLYGTSTVGGVNGFGTVYEVALQQGKWQFTTLYTFKGYPDAALPYGGLVSDNKGNLYGTTYYAGENGLGTVYKISNVQGTWTETVLYSFKGGLDGDSPISTMVADGAGNLYGTTSDGGSPSCSCGTIFKMTHTTSGKWIEGVAYRFQGAPHPGFAYNGMVTDSAGNFFGATVHGGTGDDGAIYGFTP
jgi:uncharacterized repeat protein (TIGR03803 family)